jgi:hypothetical protein
MTEHAPHGQVRSEEDRISTGKILVVGIGSLLLFFFAAVVTSSYLRMRQGERPAVPIPAEIGRSKIGLVEQQLFDQAVRGERDRAVREERLRSYGWVDRRQGIVHIPIERAMELVAGGARPAPGGAPEATPPGGQP